MSNRRRLKPPRQWLRPGAVPLVETFWNGQRTPCTRGRAVVADAPEVPLYWARAEGLIGVTVNVVQVDYAGCRWWMYDEDGTGWLKVTEGHGSPRYGHRDVAIEPGSFRLRGGVPT